MMPHPLRVLRTLPAPVRLLVAGSFVNKLGTFIIPYLTLVLRKDFQLRTRRRRACSSPTAEGRWSRSWSEASSPTSSGGA
jgi:hypothetical protein